MKILVACEESQAVTIELRRLGHEAYSCDVIPCSGGHPEWHLQQDVIPLLAERWDMVLAFPPCTYLTAAGAIRLFNHDGTVKDPERYKRGEAAARFFNAFLSADCPRVAVENPVMMKCFGIPKYQQIVEPYMFGDPWRKRTCLWLRGLPPPASNCCCGTKGPLGREHLRYTGPHDICPVRAAFQQGPKAESKDIPRHCKGDGRAMGWNGGLI